MVTSARLRFILLALMVAASNVALVSHVAAHFQPQLDQCELCVSQAQPLAAVPTTESEVCVPAVSVKICSNTAVRPIPASVAHPWFQRAPPFASS